MSIAYEGPLDSLFFGPEEPQMSAGSREDGQQACPIDSNDVATLIREINLDDARSMRRLNALSPTEMCAYVQRYLDLAYDVGAADNARAYCEAALKLYKLSHPCSLAVNTVLGMMARISRINANQARGQGLPFQRFVDAWGAAVKSQYLCGVKAESYEAKKDGGGFGILNQLMTEFKDGRRVFPGFPSDTWTVILGSKAQVLQQELDWVRLVFRTAQNAAQTN